jgi:hypothetical protein
MECPSAGPSLFEWKEVCCEKVVVIDALDASGDGEPNGLSH